MSPTSPDSSSTPDSGGLNWYRNVDRRWEQTPFLAGAKLQQPTLFVAGELDAVIAMRRAAFDTLEQTVPQLRGKILLPGAGHWIQQERPAEVNQLLLEFLAGVTRIEDEQTSE
jgi:pimeloyl-ACP methyl ester carboxylesterase